MVFTIPFCEKFCFTHTFSKKLLVEFNNGIKYEYDDVPHKVYTQFRMAESQGKFFSTNIAKNYKYVKK